MKILALEIEVKDTNNKEFRKYLNEEAEKVYELYESGIIREVYFRGDQTTAVLLLECKDIEEAKSVISSLPLVKNGLITFEVIPLIPYAGFARLFKNKKS
ncbi:muconolactone Delta-isomerase family protein [Bacteroidota bacterium]